LTPDEEVVQGVEVLGQGLLPMRSSGVLPVGDLLRGSGVLEGVEEAEIVGGASFDGACSVLVGGLDWGFAEEVRANDSVFVSVSISETNIEIASDHQEGGWRELINLLVELIPDCWSKLVMLRSRMWNIDSKYVDWSGC